MKKNELVRLTQNTQEKLDLLNEGEILEVVLSDKKYVGRFSDYFSDYEIVKQGEASPGQYVFQIKNRIGVNQNA